MDKTILKILFSLNQICDFILKEIPNEGLHIDSALIPESADKTVSEYSVRKINKNSINDIKTLITQLVYELERDSIRKENIKYELLKEEIVKLNKQNINKYQTNILLQYISNLEERFKSEHQ